MRLEVNPNQFEILGQGEISLWYSIILLSGFTDFRLSETDFSAISVNLTEVKFQTALSFPCKH